MRPLLLHVADVAEMILSVAGPAHLLGADTRKHHAEPARFHRGSDGADQCLIGGNLGQDVDRSGDQRHEFPLPLVQEEIHSGIGTVKALEQSEQTGFGAAQFHIGMDHKDLLHGCSPFLSAPGFRCFSLGINISTAGGGISS